MSRGMLAAVIFVTHIFAILVAVLLVTGVSAEPLQTFRVFKDTSGYVHIFKGEASAKRPGETDAEFYDRETPERFKDHEFEDISSADVPVGHANRRQWRLRTRGGRREVFVDPGAPTEVNR